MGVFSQSNQICHLVHESSSASIMWSDVLVRAWSQPNVSFHYLLATFATVPAGIAFHGVQHDAAIVANGLLKTIGEVFLYLKENEI